MTQGIDRTGEPRDSALVETTSGDEAFAPAIAARLEGAIGAARRDPPPPPPGAPHPPETPSPAPASGLSAQEWPGKSPAAPAGLQTARTGTVEVGDGAGTEAANRGAGRGIAKTLAERAETHGDFERVAEAAQSIKNALCGPSYGVMSFVQREALDLIATKLARIACGDADFLDHWEDIVGYAQLVVDDLRAAPK